MHITSAAYGKGGVGKSNTALGLALETAAKGLKTVIWDFDQQETITSALLGIDHAITNADLARLDTTLDAGSGIDSVSPIQVKDNLYLLPSHPELSKLDRESLVNVLDNVEHHLRDFDLQGFDLCIIDPPGSLENRLLVSMIVSHSIYVPFEPSYESHSAFKKWYRLYQTIKNNPRYNPNLQFLGLVYTKVGKVSYRNTTDHNQFPEITIRSEHKIFNAYSEKLPTLGLIASRDVIKTTISKGKRLESAPASDSKKAAMREFNQFVTNFLVKTGLQRIIHNKESAANEDFMEEVQVNG